MEKGEVWFAKFPKEDKPLEVMDRPVIVLAETEEDNTVQVLSIKVTKTGCRDKWDYELQDWEEANFKYISIARTSKAMYINKSEFRRKVGKLTENDLKKVEDLFIKWYMEQYDKKIE